MVAWSAAFGDIAVQVQGSAEHVALAASLLPAADASARPAVVYAVDPSGPGVPLASQAAPPEPCPARSIAEVVWHAGRFAAARLPAGTPGLHAALLGTASGGVVVLGASEAGKSTLTAASALQGLTPFGDEIAVIQRDGTVAALPRPITLAEHSADLLHGFDRLAPALDAGRLFVRVSPPSPVEVAAVLDLRRGESLALEALRPARTLVLLCREVVGRTPPAESFRVLARLARRAPGFRLTSNDPMAAAALLVETFGRPLRRDER